MKKNIFVLLFVIFSIHSFAQDKKKLLETFEKDIKEYLEAYNTGDMEKVTGMIYPKLFDLVSKEQLIQTIVQLEQMGMKIKTEYKKIESVSEVIKHENEQFCKIGYHGIITIKISGELLDSKDNLKENLGKIYGEKNVIYDESKQEFTIDAHKHMIGVLSSNNKEWKYVEYNASEEEILVQLIPEEVIKKLK